MTRFIRVACALAALVAAPAYAQEDAVTEEEPGDAEAAPEHPLSLHLSAGLGIGTRAVDVPLDGALHQTRTGAFPAFVVGFDLQYAASSAFGIGLVTRYQSSVLGHPMVEQHTDGTDRPMDVRAHRFELSLAPTLFFDDARRWSLGLAAGYATRNLRPEVHHLLTPSYSLSGPHLRLDLGLPLWEDMLRLRLGPEAHILVDVGSEVRDRDVAGEGLGLGFEAALALKLTAALSVHLTYRETHASLDTEQGESFSDVGRYVTTRLEGRL